MGEKREDAVQLRFGGCFVCPHGQHALVGFVWFFFVCLFFFLALEPCCVDDKSETNGALDAGHTYTREKSRIARSCR
jgi:hypothetical protein